MKRNEEPATAGADAHTLAGAYAMDAISGRTGNGSSGT